MHPTRRQQPDSQALALALSHSPSLVKAMVATRAIAEDAERRRRRLERRRGRRRTDHPLESLQRGSLVAVKILDRGSSLFAKGRHQRRAAAAAAAAAAAGSGSSAAAAAAAAAAATDRGARLRSLQRLHSEIRALSRCGGHRNVVSFFECLVTPQRIYSFMEFVGAHDDGADSLGGSGSVYDGGGGGSSFTTQARRSRGGGGRSARASGRSSGRSSPHPSGSMASPASSAYSAAAANAAAAASNATDGGADLLDTVIRLGRLPERRALLIFAQLLRGLGHCHACGVVHR